MRAQTHVHGDKPRTRLAVMQGPSQALTVVSLLRYLAETERPGRDILVHGGLFTFSAAAKDRVIAGSRRVAALWHWDKEVVLGGGESILDQDYLPEAIHQAVGTDQVDTLYLTRNFQAANLAMIRAYPHARLCIYGDIMLLDFYRAAEYAEPAEVVTEVPILTAPGLLNGIPYRLIPSEVARGVIKDACTKLTSDAQWQDAFPQAPPTNAGCLFLSGILTECGFTTLENEIALYRLCTKDAVKTDGCAVYVKPHPRESLGQSKLLVEVLRNRDGLDARECPEVMQEYTAEILYATGRFPKVISPTSWAPHRLLWLFGTEQYQYESVLGRLELIEPQYRKFIRDHLQASLRVRAELLKWDGRQPICHVGVSLRARLQMGLRARFPAAYAWARNAYRTAFPRSIPNG